jgi:hypothetical protein
MLSKIFSLIKPSIAPEQVDCTHHKILKDPILNSELIQNGFIVLPMLEQEQIEYLKRLYHKWHKDSEPMHFYKSYYSKDSEYKDEVEAITFEFLTPKLKEYFTSFDLMGGMFVIKPHGKEGHIPPHQDFSLVDESKYWSLNSWCPLEDTHEDYGILKMLPGSHRMMHTIRGYGIPEHYTHLADTIEKNFVPIKMKAGECIFFYLSIVHGSSYNIRKEPRVALGCSILPESHQLEYNIIPDGASLVKRYSVDKDFFRNYTHAKKSEPEESNLIKSFQPNFHRMTERQLKRSLKEIEKI